MREHTCQLTRQDENHSPSLKEKSFSDTQCASIKTFFLKSGQMISLLFIHKEKNKVFLIVIVLCWWKSILIDFNYILFLGYTFKYLFNVLLKKSSFHSNECEHIPRNIPAQSKDC